MARWAGLRGVPATVDEIVVTAGAQHSLLAALATLARPGDTVLTEAVTYTGLISVANHAPAPRAGAGRCRRARRRRFRSRREAHRGARRLPHADAAEPDRRHAHRRPSQGPAAGRDPARRHTDRGRRVRRLLEHAAARRRRPGSLHLPDRRVEGGGAGPSRRPAARAGRAGAAARGRGVRVERDGTAVRHRLVGRWLADGLAERVIAWKRGEFQARTAGAQILGPGGGCATCRRSARNRQPTALLGGVEFMEQARLRGVSSAPVRLRGRPGAAVRADLLGPPSTARRWARRCRAPRRARVRRCRTRRRCDRQSGSCVVEGYARRGIAARSRKKPG